MDEVLTKKTHAAKTQCCVALAMCGFGLCIVHMARLQHICVFAYAHGGNDVDSRRVVP